LIYPYADRDLFAEPESYEYAKCDGADYLKEWEESRTTARLAFSRRANEQPGTAAAKESCNVLADAVSLRSLLLQPLSNGTSRLSSDRAKADLDPFVVKFEVFGRLFSWYRSDGRRHPDSPHTDLPTYILFAQRLCEIVEYSGSLKHLSTLLKLCDSLASHPLNRFEPDEARLVVDILDREKLLVQSVAETE